MKPVPPITRIRISLTNKDRQDEQDESECSVFLSCKSCLSLFEFLVGLRDATLSVRLPFESASEPRDRPLHKVIASRQVSEGWRVSVQVHRAQVGPSA